MRTLTKAVLVSIGISLAGAALAAPGYGPGSGQGPGANTNGPCMRGGGPAAFGARLDALKSELKLTDAQLPAWNAFEKTVQTQRDAMQQERGQVKNITDPNQRMDAHIAFMEQRVEGMKAVAQARKELYNTLTPEQKTVADRYWSRMGGHGAHA